MIYLSKIKIFLIIQTKIPLIGENSFIKNFVKSTKALNIIWREFIKKYFFKNRIDENYVRQIFR